MKCTNCGASLSDSAKFCPECGTKVVRELFCAECGTKLAAGTKFCPECGTKVGGSAASAPKAAKESYPKDNGSSKWLTIKDGVLTDCDDEAEGEVIIPEGVTKIGADAFEDCEKITSVVIPEGVTKIGVDSLFGAFHDCKALASVVIPESVTEIGEHAFKGCNITEVSHPCLTIKGGVAIKDRVAEYCASQASKIVIPDGVTKIVKMAFSGCMALTSVEIPDSVTEIEKKAFIYCESLSSITFGGTKKEWKAVKKDDDWHEGVPAKGVECSDGMVKFGLFG